MSILARARLADHEAAIEAGKEEGSLFLLEGNPAVAHTPVAGDIGVTLSTDGKYWLLGGPLSYPAAPAGTTAVSASSEAGETYSAALAESAWVMLVPRSGDDEVKLRYCSQDRVLEEIPLALRELAGEPDGPAYYAPR